MSSSFSYFHTLDQKHQDTISVVKIIAKEYFDMTKPFSFDFNDKINNYRIHVFIVCGKKFSEKRESKFFDIDNDFIDIADNNENFLFHAYLFSEQMNGKRRSSKAPFFVGKYSFDCDIVFNEFGHINNNAKIKNNFIELVKEHVLIDVRKTQKKYINFIVDNDFSCYLTKQKKINKKNLTDRWPLSFYGKINEGFNIFYEKITFYKKHIHNIRNKNKTYYSTEQKSDIKKLKLIKFYDALNDVINSEEDIYYVKTNSFLYDPFLELYKRRKVFFRIYTEKQYNHIKSIIKYLKKLKINWELANYCAYDPDFYEEKYNLLNAPKKVKTSSGKYVYPRIDFMKTYKSIVQTSSIDELKGLMTYVDNLQSLKQADLKLFGRSLTPAERKMIVGKAFRQANEDEKNITKIMFKNLDFKQCISLKETQYEESCEILYANRIYNLFNEYIKQETFIKAMPKNMSFKDVFFHICKIYDLHENKNIYKEDLKNFNANGRVERLILDRIPNNFKVENVDNIISNKFEYYSSDNIDPIISLNFELTSSVYDIKKEIKEGNIIGIDIEDVIIKSEEVKKYIRKTYIPEYNEIYIKNQIKDINDSLSLFNKRVIDPICAYKTGIYGAYCFEIGGAVTEDIFKMFSCGSKDILNIIRMSNAVHDYPDQFINAGKNTSSLFQKDERLQLSHYGQKKDNVRESFFLSSHYAWSPGINGIFEIFFNDNDYVIIPLINNEELKEEGQEMRHCVGWGDYDNKSSRGMSKIFSVRKKINGVFKRLSTLELSFNYEEEKVTLEQNFAYRNSISDEANTIAEKLVNVINLKEDKIVPWDYIQLEQNTVSIYTDTKNIASEAGYLPNNVEAIKKAMKPWLPYLDKKYHDIESYIELDFVKKRIVFSNL